MFEKMQQWFHTYTASYKREDQEFNRAIQIKIDHSIRTAGLAADIALHEGFSPDDVETARVTGLFHDIGRFEQYRQFRTFADHQSLNHGELGAQILLQNNCLSGLEPKRQNQIYKSVRYHNRCALPEDETPDVLAFSRLVRDADKIDIFYLTSE